MKRVGRNEPCPCGSGKKYKNCHQKADSEKAAGSNKNMLIGGVVLVIIVLAIVAIFLNVQSSGTTPPPGEAPAGKVWSPEHGHWHDAE